MENRYRFARDANLLSEALDLPLGKIAEEAHIPEPSFYRALRGDDPSKDLLEAFYGYAYKKGLRLNKAKEEIYKETLNSDEILLFHGSSEGIKKIDPLGSRTNSDFSHGFYLGESYLAALSFVEGDPFSSVYVFKARLEGLQVKRFASDLAWMLSICLNRGTLKQYEGSEMLTRLKEEQKECDLIIAPIANNKMYRVMQEFAKGKITDKEAIHALSASRLGKQYVFKSDKALARLTQIERLYLSEAEKEKSKEDSIERAFEIETKLNMAKREYRGEGQYVDEVLI